VRGVRVGEAEGGGRRDGIGDGEREGDGEDGR